MANNNDIVVYDSTGKKAKKAKKPMNWKRLLMDVGLCLGIGLVYFLSPIDIIPDPAAAAGGAGMYDDLAVGAGSIISAVVMAIVDFVKLKKGK